MSDETLEVVGHCSACGNPIYGPVTVGVSVGRAIVSVRRSCVCPPQIMVSPIAPAPAFRPWPGYPPLQPMCDPGPSVVKPTAPGQTTCMAAVPQRLLQAV